tara:strand:+ start:1198 stop:1437 length:240 start_codon:yes stop_codon:yes gene_type:complete
MKFFKDIMTEDLKEGKYSSKKVMGLIAGLLGFVAFVVDGFHFYDINDNMFDSMLIFSATMLGVSVLRKFAPGVKTTNKK